MVWISPSIEMQRHSGCAVSAGGSLGMAVSGLWNLRRGSAHWVSGGAFSGMSDLGFFCGNASAAGICLFLEFSEENRCPFSVAGKKIFAFCENFVCIC